MEVVLVSVGILACAGGTGLGYTAYRARFGSRTGTAFTRARMMEGKRKNTDDPLEDSLLETKPKQPEPPVQQQQPPSPPKESEAKTSEKEGKVIHIEPLMEPVPVRPRGSSIFHRKEEEKEILRKLREQHRHEAEEEAAHQLAERHRMMSPRAGGRLAVGAPESPASSVKRVSISPGPALSPVASEQAASVSNDIDDDLNDATTGSITSGGRDRAHTTYIRAMMSPVSPVSPTPRARNKERSGSRVSQNFSAWEQQAKAGVEGERNRKQSFVNATSPFQPKSTKKRLTGDQQIGTPSNRRRTINTEAAVEAS